jgi:hypothetical protein
LKEEFAIANSSDEKAFDHIACKPLRSAAEVGLRYRRFAAAVKNLDIE